MIRAVIFDMFETLITHFESPLYFGVQMAADAGIPEADFQAVWRPAEDDRTLGKLTLEELLERVLKENQCYSPELLQKLADKRRATKEECFRHLHGEILPVLEALKEQEIKIGLVSNCFSEEAEVIRRSALFPFFDAACLSCEQGLKKPDPEIFLLCMDKLNVDPGECIYVGDGGSRELEAARELGMKPVQAVWYLKEGVNQPSGRKADFVQAKTPLEVLRYVDLASERIARIIQMENILDEVLYAIENHPEAVGEDAALGEKIDTLFNYYEGGLWLLDYEADEAGELPQDLKRGVLAQDTLYDLGIRVDQIRGLQ